MAKSTHTPAHIQAKNIVVEFPIYNTSHRSLKNTLLSATTGGRVAKENATKHLVVRAINNVSFEAGMGQKSRIALVGHNGSGKTTLLRTLAGVYTPVAGTLSVQGSISSLVDVSLGMDPEATGEENVFLRGVLMGLSRKTIDHLFDDIAAFADLGQFLLMPVRTYSAGMRLRLAFAISTCVQTDIILMDEWLSVGDKNFAEKAEKRLRERIAESAVLVIATHSEQLASSLCDRIIKLEHGVVVSDQNV
jgi:lipopolysaccharide transport system ATP-binding protein